MPVFIYGKSVARVDMIDLYQFWDCFSFSSISYIFIHCQDWVCGEGNCIRLWVELYQGEGERQAGYIEEARTIFQPEDGCCFDNSSRDKTRELGASGILNTREYFKRRNKIFIDVWILTRHFILTIVSVVGKHESLEFVIAQFVVFVLVIRGEHSL